MPRKIKVSDITPENYEKDPVNDEVEVIKETEPVEETQEKQEERLKKHHKRYHTKHHKKHQLK